MATPTRQGGGARRERPGIDAARLTDGWPGSILLDRIAAAGEARNEASTLAGRFAEICRAALAEAHAQGVDVTLSTQSIRDAVRPDRQPLQSALEILARGRRVLGGIPSARHVRPAPTASRGGGPRRVRVGAGDRPAS